MAALALTLLAALVALLLLRFVLGLAAGLLVLALLCIGAATLMRMVSVPNAPAEPQLTDCATFPDICRGYDLEYNSLHEHKRMIRD